MCLICKNVSYLFGQDVSRLVGSTDDAHISASIPLGCIRLVRPADGLPSVDDWLTTCISFLFTGSRLHREPLDMFLLDPTNATPGETQFLGVKKGFTRLKLGRTCQMILDLLDVSMLLDGLLFSIFMLQGQLHSSCSWWLQTWTQLLLRTDNVIVCISYDHVVFFIVCISYHVPGSSAPHDSGGSRHVQSSSCDHRIYRHGKGIV